MRVEVAKAPLGIAEPLVERFGSIRYGRVSRVAAEVGGIVEKVCFSEGARVKAGQPLVKLSSDLRQTSLAGTRANYEQVLVKLERARKDLHRIEALYSQQSVAEVLYDDNRYGVQARANFELAEAQRGIAGSACLPTISLGYSYLERDEDPFLLGEQSTTLSLNGSINLFNGPRAKLQ